MMNYFQESELIGDNLFKEWANQVQCFKSMKRQSLYSRVDWRCISIKNNSINCELKVRTSLKYPSIFIEPGKYDFLMNEYKEKGNIPWFINLTTDGLVYIFDLRSVKPIRLTDVTIYDKANSCYKPVQRYELPTDKAIKFKNGIRIK